MIDPMLSTGQGIFLGIIMFVVGTCFGYGMGSLNKFVPQEEP